MIWIMNEPHRGPNRIYKKKKYTEEKNVKDNT